MRYCTLGKTGFTVSRLCFGTLTIGPLGAHLPLHKGAALLREAFDTGINFYDTAQYYRNYQYLATAFGGGEQRPIIASKSFAASYEEMAKAVEEARIGLKRDKIDIFLLHEVRGEEDWQERRPAWEYLQNAKANGIVGAVGLSTHCAKTAYLAATLPEVELVHAMYNMRGVGVNNGGAKEMGAALAKAKAAGKGVYGMKAIGGGALMKEAHAALNWAFTRPELDAVAVGMKDSAELITNSGWLMGLKPMEEQLVRQLPRRMAFEKDPICHHCGACLARCPQQALYLTEDGVGWAGERCLYCGYCIAACPWFCISFV